ncbi:MAG: hypothetical protein ACLGQW_06300 [Acidobacteriota bacterium]
MSTGCERQQSGNMADCPCTYPGCPRYGNCCQCVAHHRAKDQLPACYFTKEQEATFNRSIAFFMDCRQG